MSEGTASSRNRIIVRILEIIVAVALVAVAAWLLIGMRRLSTQLAAPNNNRDSLLREVQTLHSAMDAQTIVMNRALGKVIPAVMPPQWEKQLSDLESQVKEQARWPKNEAEARRFLEHVTSLVKSTPAWAEADYLPRLTPIRWAALAFMSLTQPRDDAALPSIIEETSGLVNAAPDGVSADLLQKLKQEANLLDERLEQLNLANAIKAGEAYLQNPASPSDDSWLGIASVYKSLDLYKNEGAQADRIRELQAKLHLLMVVHQGDQQATSLKKRWSIVQMMEKTQPDLFESAVTILLQEVATTRVTMALEGVKQPTLDSLESTLRHVIRDRAAQAAKQEQERYAEAMRYYQRWALGEIVAFEHKFGFIEQHAAKDARTWKRDNGGWSDARFKEVRDAMVARLLPVNLALCDPPIQQRYDKAFQKGWSKLDGREDQTFVAEQTAFVVKKTVQDFYGEESAQTLKARHAYEQWAGKQIEEFASVFSGVLEGVAKRRAIDWKTVADPKLEGGWELIARSTIYAGFVASPALGGVWEIVRKKLLMGWNDADRERVRDALVQYLLPVNPELLGPLLQEQLHRAYKAGMYQLTPADKAWVEKQKKDVKKRAVSDFLEG